MTNSATNWSYLNFIFYGSRVYAGENNNNEKQITCKLSYGFNGSLFSALKFLWFLADSFVGHIEQ